jgi:hypothetical protein
MISGKFIFAFSIFWTYLWFSQFMLIWYANIPEETTLFQTKGAGNIQRRFLADVPDQFPGADTDINEQGCKTELYNHDIYGVAPDIRSLA